TLWAFTLEPLEDFPQAFELPSTPEGLRAFNHAFGHFNGALFPEDTSWIVLCTTDRCRATLDRVCSYCPLPHAQIRLPRTTLTIWRTASVPAARLNSAYLVASRVRGDGSSRSVGANGDGSMTEGIPS